MGVGGLLEGSSESLPRHKTQADKLPKVKHVPPILNDNIFYMSLFH